MSDWNIEIVCVVGDEAISRSYIRLGCALRDFYNFCFSSALALIFSLCSMLLNLPVILFHTLHVDSLSLDSWVLPFDVESTSKALSAKYLPTIDSYLIVRPYLEESVSGWYISKPRGEEEEVLVDGVWIFLPTCL